MNAQTEKVLVNGDRVCFDWNDPKAPTPGQSYGRAEFVVCLIWNTRLKKPTLKKFYIYHSQQRDIKHFYRVDCGWSDSFVVQSWTYKGMVEPRVWFHGWCKEHNAPFFRLYVPPDSKSFTVSTLSSAGMNFDNEQ